MARHQWWSACNRLGLGLRVQDSGLVCQSSYPPGTVGKDYLHRFGTLPARAPSGFFSYLNLLHPCDSLHGNHHFPLVQRHIFFDALHSSVCVVHQCTFLSPRFTCSCWYGMSSRMSLCICSKTSSGIFRKFSMVFFLLIPVPATKFDKKKSRNPLFRKKKQESAIPQKKTGFRQKKKWKKKMEKKNRAIALNITRAQE